MARLHFALERIRIVKDGIPARTVEAMARRMAVPKERLVATLGLTRATVDRKARDNKPLSIDESARVLGMARLVGQVQEMVTESGDPAGFDAASWVARWLQSPLPAFGGKRPAEFMDTADGQSLVSAMVRRYQESAINGRRRRTASWLMGFTPGRHRVGHDADTVLRPDGLQQLGQARAGLE